MKKGVPSYYDLRQKLIADNILQKTEEGYIFSRDVYFNSSSAAAATCYGGSASGPAQWKDRSGNSLRDNRKKAVDE